jgi:hypothetical protein
MVCYRGYLCEIRVADITFCVLQLLIRQVFEVQMIPWRAVSGSPPPGLKFSSGRHMFSQEEDEHLRQLVTQLGDRDWKTIAKQMPNRTTRQCRERYKNYLSPELRNAPWSPAEDALLMDRFAEFGPKWATLATFFNGRSDVSLKNRWTVLNGRHNLTLVPVASQVTAPRPILHIQMPSPGSVHQEMVAIKMPLRQSESDGKEAQSFRISKLMWSPEERQNETPHDADSQKLRNTFPNHGGDIW